jgi:hypothetical protein
MNLNQQQQREAVILALVAGTIISVTYPLMNSYHSDSFWALLMEVTFGPLFIIGTLGLFLFIYQKGNSIYNLIAMIFHVLAGLSETLMLSVQRSVFSMRPDYQLLEYERSREIFQRSFQVGNLTQLGMDFCFDIFVSLGTLFLAIALLRQASLFRWLAYPGIVVGAGGLLLNMLTFPTPPADLKYPDPGPFFGIYFGLVLLNIIYVIYQSRSNDQPWI